MSFEHATMAFELYLDGFWLLAILRATKLGAFSVSRTLPKKDRLLLAIFAGLVAGAAQIHVFWGCVFGLLFAGLLAALWLDAILFRIFTFELGPGGVFSVVLSALYRELAELSHPRRFLSANLWLLPYPLVALLATAPALVGGPLDPTRRAALLGYLALGLWRARAPIRWDGALHGLSLLALSFGAPPSPSIVAISWIILIILPGSSRPSVLTTFLGSHRLPDTTNISVQPEHRELLAFEDKPLASTTAQGKLAGCNVLLYSIESLGRHHIASEVGTGAELPCFDRLAGAALRVERHFCVCPMTNEAHVSLYRGQYVDGRGESALGPLRQKGYRTVYLSTADTRLYGLSRVLKNAGFDRVIDAEQLAKDCSGGLSDRHLVDHGLQALEETLRDSEPFFLHVHTSNTHLPYRVIDRQRFSRHGFASDRARFLNGLEEADFTLEAFLSALDSRGRLKDTLLVITGDHGQAFGELGYHSHGSAVIKQEIEVPAIFHHRSLAKKTVDLGCHFDVLPTVLDLLGVEGVPSQGASLLGDPRKPELLVWAGRPSRRWGSNFGLIFGTRKLMLDLVLDRMMEMDLEDLDARELDGEERRYWSAVLARAARAQGLG